jgi:potassium-transporting ATPase KdpC subunit
MFKQLLPSALVLVVLSVITGLAYPLLVTGVARLVCPDAAAGSRVRKGGVVVGSSLIGQEFDDPKYFWGRPSATAPAYNAGASSGSNYGPLNPALKEAAESRATALRAADPGNAAPIPVDLCTASGSGLDPHISPAAAYWQVSRVAKVRGLSQERLRALVSEHVEPRTLGLLGEPRVNVLMLNLALDEAR